MMWWDLPEDVSLLISKSLEDNTKCMYAWQWGSGNIDVYDVDPEKGLVQNRRTEHIRRIRKIIITAARNNFVQPEEPVLEADEPSEWCIIIRDGPEKP